MTDWSFEGTYTALVTPFVTGGEKVDFAALEQLVEEQIEGGVQGLVACGTTGETPTLSDVEQREVTECVVRVAAGRVRVVAGTGSFNTHKSIAASRAALEVGADAVMVVMPYYSKPSQEGLRQHVLAVARALRGPIILYNIPGRTGVDLAPHSTEWICDRASNVVAVKDATGNVLRCQKLKQRLGDRLTMMCGDDALTLPMMAAGASGVISVTSNVVPDRVAEVVGLMAAGKLSEARQRHYALLELHESMFVAPNPVPCKLALSLLGKMEPDVRLPLVEADTMDRGRVAAALEGAGLLSAAE
ncbi:MAG: 4-hydroxy-tetrahydrodipicolinate synthase [Deltaproteobacteria bacterium]|jgi:4-hydroxy-tetrahydrodipicolinate synthase|nr:4-hydroxy-tetrahydrodipicolinate synthase [Deltaproteobacteria bacterium]MBW2530851.1 4-hydroxy-tetrahydrodipicolinate synthase [Deltaproteobacteria bacterium]